MAEQEIALKLALKGQREAAAGLKDTQKNVDEVGKTAKTATADAGGLGAKMGALGGTLTKTLTPALGGIAVAARMAFKEFDQGRDSIVASTGKTGKALDELTGSARNVAMKIGAPMGQVGQIVGDLNAKLNLTGKPLEDITKQLTYLQRIGQAMTSDQVAGMIRAWGISADQAAPAIDKIVRAGQLAGKTAPDIAAGLASGTAPLKRLNYNFDQSLSVITTLRQRGIDTDRVFGAMTRTMAKTAKAGAGVGEAEVKVREAQEKLTKATEEYGAESLEAEKATMALAKAEDKLGKASGDVVGEMKLAIRQIQEAPSAAAAFDIAAKVFGRDAQVMTTAIRSGAFEAKNWTEELKNAEGTTKKVHDATRGFTETLGEWKNRAMALIGPHAELISNVAGVGAAVGPALSGVGALLEKIAGRKTAKIAVEVGTETAAEVAGEGIFAALRSKLSQRGAVKLGENIIEEASATAAGEVAGTTLAGGLAKVGPAAVASGGMAATGASGFSALAASMWAVVWPVLVIVGFLAVLAGAFLFLTKVLGVDTVTAIQILLAVLFPVFIPINLLILAVRKLGVSFSDVWGFITAVVKGGVALVKTHIDIMVAAFKAALNFAIGFLNIFIKGWNMGLGLLSKIPGVPDIRVPEIPKLASGGEVTSSGMAVVGDAGPELVRLPVGAEVVPLSGNGAAPIMAASSGPRVVQVVLNGKVIAEAVVEELQDTAARR